jgi:hypothetical protein
MKQQRLFARLNFAAQHLGDLAEKMRASEVLARPCK